LSSLRPQGAIQLFSACLLAVLLSARGMLRGEEQLMNCIKDDEQETVHALGLVQVDLHLSSKSAETIGVSQATLGNLVIASQGIHLAQKDAVLGTEYLTLNIIAICATVAFAAFSIPDFVNFFTNLPKKSKQVEEPVKENEVDNVGQPPQRGGFFIFGITFYRFYTGYLSATWLPFLLAMEGSRLMPGNQAFFMGIAKLIYGFVIFLNPVVGLIGDKASLVSHGVARRMFVRIGIIIAALGILLCLIAGPERNRDVFLVGVFIWRVGEAFNDVTTEAICPEMLAKSQYEISSAVRASMFLVGGLSGYAMIAWMAHVHYSWLYYAYLLMMFVCGVPQLLLIGHDGVARTSTSSSINDSPILLSLLRAYTSPASYEGGFPLACLSTFLFSFGTAPMFFIMLLIRDLVGLNDPIQLQQHFSMTSLDFFICAAISAVVGAVISPTRRDASTREAGPLRLFSFFVLGCSVVAFGVIVLFLPAISLLDNMNSRMQAFYVIAGVMGATFGSVYSRFQDCTWQLLPPQADVANAMGFATMCKLLGAGVGNFIAGVILSYFTREPSTIHLTRDGGVMESYKVSGYIIMCALSAGCSFLSGLLVIWLARKARDHEDATKMKLAMPK